MIEETGVLFGEDCRLKADSWLVKEGEKPRGYIGAVVVVALWFVLGFVAYRLPGVHAIP
ncbi:MAG: hypothetical protein M3N82_07030 [Pseudomonadota bacterium]|nr:hypothetical protein [Pseudomonadota bacterium]